MTSLWTPSEKHLIVFDDDLERPPEILDKPGEIIGRTEYQKIHPTKIDYFSQSNILPNNSRYRIKELGIGGLKLPEREGQVRVLVTIVENQQKFFDIFENNERIHTTYPKDFGPNPFTQPDLTVALMHLTGKHPEYASSLDACLDSLRK
jgi:hypothetical protein